MTLLFPNSDTNFYSRNLIVTIIHRYAKLIKQIKTKLITDFTVNIESMNTSVEVLTLNCFDIDAPFRHVITKSADGRCLSL